MGLCALFAHSAASAGEFRCANLKPSPTQSPPYQRVAGQARCEGFYEQNVSHPFIELVSLTASAPSRQEGGALTVSASRLAAMQLVVQPLRPAPFYRVDAQLDAAQSLRWDAAQMLGATGLQLRDLGFLAQSAGPDGTPTFVPISFGSANEAPQTVLGVLRASVPVAKLSWRRLRLDGSDDGSGGWREIPGPSRFAWERVPITMNMPAQGRGVQIDVQATDPAGKILPLLHFNMAGPTDALP